MIKQGGEFVPNTEQQALLMRARQLLLKYIQQEDEKTLQKQGLRSVAKVLQEKERKSSCSFAETPYLTPVLIRANRINFLNSVSNSYAN